jgi:predicted lipoprotein with Yx(FWY)xxD motif
MINSANRRRARSLRPQRTSALRSCAAFAALAFAGSLAAIAFATSPTTTINAASNSKLGEQVLVDSQGRTLYALNPETTSHLLCKSSACLKFWPPVTVASRKTKLTAGSGVQGRLGILRRNNGMLQITFRGLPLYRYVGDHAKGEANGQGIESFGGTWHALSSSADPSKAAATPPPTATTPGSVSSSGGYESSAGGTTSTSPATTTPTTPTTTTTPMTPTKPAEEKYEEPKTKTETPPW